MSPRYGDKGLREIAMQGYEANKTRISGMITEGLRINRGWMRKNEIFDVCKNHSADQVSRALDDLEAEGAIIKSRSQDISYKLNELR